MGGCPDAYRAWHRRLQVSPPYHGHLGMPLTQGQQDLCQFSALFNHPEKLLFTVQPQVYGHLVVTAPRRVDPFARIPKLGAQRPLDGQVHVLVPLLNREPPRPGLPHNRHQLRLHGPTLPLREKRCIELQLREHRHMRCRTDAIGLNQGRIQQHISPGRECQYFGMYLPHNCLPGCHGSTPLFFLYRITASLVAKQTARSLHLVGKNAHRDIGRSHALQQ